MRVLKHIKAIGLSLVMMTSLCLTSLIGSGGSVIANASNSYFPLFDIKTDGIAGNSSTGVHDDGNYPAWYDTLDFTKPYNGGSGNIYYDSGNFFRTNPDIHFCVPDASRTSSFTRLNSFSLKLTVPDCFEFDFLSIYNLSYQHNSGSREQSELICDKFNINFDDNSHTLIITAKNLQDNSFYTPRYNSSISSNRQVPSSIDDVPVFAYWVSPNFHMKNSADSDISSYVQNDKFVFDNIKVNYVLNGVDHEYTNTWKQKLQINTTQLKAYDTDSTKAKANYFTTYSDDMHVYYDVVMTIQNKDVVSNWSVTNTFNQDDLTYNGVKVLRDPNYHKYFDDKYFDVSVKDGKVVVKAVNNDSDENFVQNSRGHYFSVTFDFTIKDPSSMAELVKTQPVKLPSHVNLIVNDDSVSKAEATVTLISPSSITETFDDLTNKHTISNNVHQTVTSKGQITFGNDMNSDVKIVNTVSGGKEIPNFTSFKLFDENELDITNDYGSVTLNSNGKYEYTIKSEKIQELKGKIYNYEITYDLDFDNANQTTLNETFTGKSELVLDLDDNRFYRDSDTITLYRSGVNAPTNSFDKSILENKQAEAVYTVSDIVDTKTEDYYYNQYELKGALDDNLQYKSAKVVDENNADASAKFTVTQDGNGAKAVAKDVNNSDFYGHTYKLQITAGVKSENTLNSLQSDNGVVTLENAGQGTLTVNNADWTVNSNIQVKVVDKSRLEALVQQAQLKQETEYTPQTWGPFNTELSEANGVLQNDDADQSAVDSAYSELESAMNSLVEKADKTQLQALVQQAVTKQQNDYTTATWTPFSSKLAAAQSVLQDDNASQTSVDNAKNELQSAMDGLVQRGNKEELRGLVEQGNAKQQKDYTPDTWGSFDAKLKAAQGVLDNVDATQGEVDTAKDDLKQAMDALREKADKSKLQDLVNQGNALNKNDYTKDSQSALEQALQSAQGVLDDDNAQSSQVEDEYNKLKKVIDGLEKKPDKSELQKAVERADALNPDDYTDDSKAGLDDAVKKAKEVLDDPDASKDDVDNALKDLNDVLDKLTEKADKSELQKTVDKAHEINPDDYLSDSLPDFNEALENAESVLADNNATQDDVDNAKNALEDAMSNLEKKPDKSDLKNLVDKAEMLDPDDYTDDNKSKLQNAIDNAKDVIDNEEATQEDVDSAKDELQNVLDNLEKKPDKTKLQNLVDEANELNPEEDNEDVQNFKDALENAQKVLDDPDATQQNIDNAYDRLKEAMDKLTGKEYTDKSELQDIIDRADKLDPDKYEDPSEFNEALKHAKDVLNDENATQQDIDDAVKRLQDAMDNLKLKDTDTDKNDNEDNKDTGAVATTTNNNNNKDDSDKESKPKALQPIEPLFVDDSGNQDYDNNVEMTPVEIPDTTQMIYSPDTGNKFMDYLPVAILLAVFAAGLIFVAIRIIKKREKDI